MESPDWLYWLSTPSVTLEDCVSISLNQQPTIRQKKQASESGGSVTWEITPHCILDGVPNGPERLYRLRMYFDSRPDLLAPVLTHGENTKRIKLIDFVRFANALDWSMPPKLMGMLTDKGAHPTKLPQETVEQPQAPNPAAVVTHTAKTRRTTALTAVIDQAKQNAVDETDWISAWNEFVAMAQSESRPPPLLGYIEGEGVKYQADNEDKPVAFLTREAFRSRAKRAK